MLQLGGARQHPSLVLKFLFNNTADPHPHSLAAFRFSRSSSTHVTCAARLPRSSTLTEHDINDTSRPLAAMHLPLCNDIIHQYVTCGYGDLINNLALKGECDLGRVRLCFGQQSVVIAFTVPEPAT